MAKPQEAEMLGAALASRRDALRSIGGVALCLSTPASGATEARTEFTPEMFGARGDGIADDYEALMALAAAVSRAGGGLVRFGSRRHYLINRAKITEGANLNAVGHIEYNGCRGLIIDLNKAIISVKGDFHRRGDLSGGRRSSISAIIPFMFNRCVDLTVRNGEMNGNADKMTRDPQVGERDGHGLMINACRQVLLEDLHIHHFSTDGVRLGISRDDVVCEQVRLNRVRLTNNARQGLTNAGAIDVLAVDSHFSDNGRTGGPYRHAPQSGVDVEPIRRSGPDSDFRALRCRFDNNRGYPVVAGKPDDVSLVELIDCHSRNAGQKRMILGAQRCIIRGGTWHNVQIACMYGVRHRASSPVSIDISGAQWTGDDPGWAPIYDLSDKQPTVRIHGNRFELRSPRPYTTTYLFQCANPNHSFEDNEVFVAQTGHSGSGNDLIGNFQNAQLVRGNRWATDATGSRRFVNLYAGAKRVEGERFSGAFVGQGMR